jgi:hypothetical protein
VGLLGGEREQLHEEGIESRNVGSVIGLMPGLVATEIVAMHARREDGLDDSVAVPMEVPARMVVYFASCADPMEYTGRLFWAERELKELGLGLDDRPAISA